MLWGDGHLGGDENDASRLATFEAMTGAPYVMGYNEPDCSSTGSADFDVATGTSTP